MDDWDDYDVRDDSILGCGPLHLMFIYDQDDRDAYDGQDDWTMMSGMTAMTGIT